MDINLVIILTIFQAFLFKLVHLRERKLQEFGLSAYSTFTIQKYTLIPSIFMIVLFFDLNFLFLLFTNLKLVVLIVSFIFLNLISKLSKVYLTNSTSYLSILPILKEIIHLPALLFFGYLINGDLANNLIYFGIFFIVLSILIRPRNNKLNRKELFNYSIFLIILLIGISSIFDPLASSLFKEIISNSNFLMFLIGFLMFLRAILIYLMNFIYKISEEDKIISKKNSIFILITTLLFFIAHIPQALALQNIPIYVFGILSSITFLVDIFSDVKNKRIEINFKTINFILTSLIGLFIISYSLYI